MPKILKAEDSKLTIDIPSSEERGDTKKSPISSPRITRATVALSTMADLDLNTLFKFIKSYDGSRETVNSFIINCNNAYDLASESQRPILFKYILSQLHGKAEVACSIKEFTSWEQLREFLKTQFCERKHYAHLLTDLQESRQNPQENVSQFSLRVETYLSQLLTEISFSNTKAKELSGRTAAMEDLALHHFLMGLHPRLSNIVRCRSPKTLNEAINLAISEERIQQSLYKRPQAEQRFANNNNKSRPGPSKPNPNVQYTTPNANSNKNDTLFCRYCKTAGHEIQNCKKREFYNNKYQSKPNNYVQKNNNNKVNHVRETPDYDNFDNDLPSYDSNDLNDQESREGATRDEA